MVPGDRLRLRRSTSSTASPTAARPTTPCSSSTTGSTPRRPTRARPSRPTSRPAGKRLIELPEPAGPIPNVVAVDFAERGDLVTFAQEVTRHPGAARCGRKTRRRCRASRRPRPSTPTTVAPTTTVPPTTGRTRRPSPRPSVVIDRPQRRRSGELLRERRDRLRPARSPGAGQHLPRPGQQAWSTWPRASLDRLVPSTPCADEDARRSGRSAIASPGRWPSCGRSVSTTSGSPAGRADQRATEQPRQTRCGDDRGQAGQRAAEPRRLAGRQRRRHRLAYAGGGPTHASTSTSARCPSDVAKAAGYDCLTTSDISGS